MASKRVMIRLLVAVAAVLLVFASPGAASLNPYAGDPGTQWEKLDGCSSFVVGKEASAGGYTMSGHTCDGNCDWQLKVMPAEKHKPGDAYVIDYKGLPGGFEHTVVAQIPEVETTYQYFFAEVPFANEYQVFFGENTTDTRPELYEMTEQEALIDWTQASALALQRGKTAREAIQTLGALIEQYGLNGSGESYLITDPQEAWVMEIAGLSHQWVAVRIPKDHVSPHANRFRICEVNLADSENYLGSPNLVSYPIQKGVYNPATDGPFCFEKVYSSTGSRESMGNRIREWRMFSLLKPSQTWDPGAMSFPLSVKPDKLLAVEDMMAMFRDYMKGTAYDMTKGMAAGPFGSPERPSIRGISWPRPIGTPSTSYFWVSQARDWLPDPIGGVAWYGFDAPYSSVYVPFYVGIDDTPLSWRSGDFTKFSEDSARWYIQALDNYSNLRFNQINADVRAAFDAIEADEVAKQAEVEQKAVELYKQNSTLARKFLTDYSTERAEAATAEARDVFYTVLAKYADGRPRATVSDEWLDLLEPPPVP